MRITTIANIKGGCSKTTTCHALTTGLKSKGFKVLSIDIDLQANLSYTMSADEQESNIYEVLKNEISLKDSIQHTKQGDIIPGSLLLAGADMEFTMEGREYLLKNALKPLKNEYDFIIIDTPPTLGILTINALTASNDVIVPMQADIYSLQGLSYLETTINKVKTYCNKDLKIAGLLITRYNGRSILNKDLKEAIEERAKELGTKLYKTVIREGVIIKETQALRESLFKGILKSNPAKDYDSFINEYLKDGVSNGKKKL